MSGGCSRNQGGTANFSSLTFFKVGDFLFSTNYNTWEVMK
ncbi:hypothetical protein HMPREF9443_01504 [Phascolarctobacterium succinatutens YIT 12067]|uniref:Uncharacterized protein n=1 Tax=Phascolarctobacterium succinatutens YIT 12067 TaxID=626939 RepID=E8LF64_9FIRM|nr:hypothetical protein HMPREF9443_01504 [Phascolarctobacterium succinatutens YIT 12067]